ncbi:MAG: GGDEF domain-containing protein [Planctomycetia bacterium]|nr:GGDEF domain-containing protein [Planctomycetia bacterium]
MVLHDNALSVLPRREHGEALLGSRSALLRKLTAIYATCGVCYAGVFGLALQSRGAAWVLAAATPIGLLAPYVHRWSGSLTLGVNYLLVDIFAALGGLVMLTGGLKSPALMWLVVLPMTAAIVHRPQSGLVWLAVVALAAAGIGAMAMAGHPFAHSMTPTGFQMLTVVSVAGLATSVLAVVAVYYRLVANANRLLHEQASRDGLTGLYNHRAMIEVLDAERGRHTSRDAHLALLMVDIDFFKDVNDRFGHAVGDLVLQDMAQEIARSVRRTDCVGRFGGEEFLCILPNCPPPTAAAIAEQIRRGCEEHFFALGEDRIPITVSVGVASYDPELDEEVQSALRRADSALYKAKRSGRNQVCIADASRPSILMDELLVRS